MKKILSLVLSSVLAATLLASCGGNNTPTTTDGPTSPPSTQPTTTEATEEPGETSDTDETEEPTETEPTEVELSGSLMIGLPGAYEVTNETVVQNFIDANPNVEVEVDSGPWGDYVQKIATQLAAGIAPDVWFQENAVILGNGAKGAAEDLAGLIESDLDTSLYANSLFAATAGDKVFGVPHDVNNIGLAYNKDLFDDAGLDYPDANWTYQDMYDAAAALTTEGAIDEKVYGYLYQGSITTGWFPFGKAYGGMILNEDKTEAVLDDNFWKGLEFAGQFVSEGLSPDSTLMGELGGARVIFGNNKAGMLYIQFSLVRLINDEFPDLNWDVAMIPLDFNGDRVVPAVTNSWMIYSRAEQENKDNAWAFLKHYLSEESQNTIAATGTSIPDLISAQQILLDSIDTQDLSAFTEGLNSAVTLDENPSWNAWRGQVQTPALDITNGIAEVSDSMKEEARTNVQNAIDTWNEENILD